MTADEFRLALEHFSRQLALAEADYAAAATRRAQYWYMQGTFLGVLFLLGLLALAGLGAASAGYSPLDGERVATGFACAVAGALGACASVSWRVLSFEELRVDAGASVLTLRGLGVVRPLVGAIFGVAIYFALRSGFLDIGDDSLYVFAFFAFVAGFSERIVPELLRKTEGTVADTAAPQTP